MHDGASWCPAPTHACAAHGPLTQLHSTHPPSPPHTSAQPRNTIIVAPLFDRPTIPSCPLTLSPVYHHRSKRTRHTTYFAAAAAAKTHHRHCHPPRVTTTHTTTRVSLTYSPPTPALHPPLSRSHHHRHLLARSGRCR